MLFLVDYENVNSRGLRGAELLTPGDSVVIYYSQGCHTVEGGALRRLLGSGCELRLEKLRGSGKNALDMCIFTYVSELFGGGSDETVCIVSGDKDFRLILKFWVERERRVYLQPSLIQCILSADEGSERAQLARAELDKLDLEAEYERYLCKRRRRERFAQLSEILGDETAAVRVRDQIETGISPRALYLQTLKTFGRARGTEIYRRLKSWRAEPL